MRYLVAVVLCFMMGVGFGQDEIITFNYSGAVESWVVPSDVYSIHISISGAQGGSNTHTPCTNYPGGLGATMAGDFSVTPGTEIMILVGEKGNDHFDSGSSEPSCNGGGGGGGGSFIWIEESGEKTLLIAAGGGGGSSKCQCGTNDGNYVIPQGLDGVINSSGTADALNTVQGGSNGGNGNGLGSYSGYGIGWNEISMNPAYIPAWGGAIFGYSTNEVSGAFGGGGTSSGTHSGGGGGGYSGGGARPHNGVQVFDEYGNSIQYISGYGDPACGGGGGGSYFSGQNQNNISGNNAGHGTATISFYVCDIPVYAGEDLYVCDIDTTIILDESYPIGGVWSGESVNNSSQPFIDVLDLSPGIYSYVYTYTDETCQIDDSFLLEVYEKPVIYFSGPQSLCTNVTGEFELTIVDGTGPYYIQWLVTNWTEIQNDGYTAINSWELAGTYYPEVIVVDLNGCQDYLEFNILVNDPPEISVDKYAFCENTGAFDLIGNPLGGMWEGTGVLDFHQFDTNIGAGEFEIFYWYIDPITACSDTSYTQVYIQEIPTGDCDCDGNQLDVLGVCGGDCSVDADSDGVCDDVDDCVGEYDECGVCNGPGAIYECGCANIPDSDCDCDGSVPEYGYDCDGNCIIDTDDDGVCDEFEINGCTELNACNFNEDATENDNSCYFIGDSCDDSDITTGNDVYNENCDCEGISIGGCMDINACNYSEIATFNNNSCIFIGDPCDDLNPLTFDDYVNEDCFCGGIEITTVSDLEALQVKIYPNPASNNLTVDLGDLTGVETSIKLFDASSKLIFDELSFSSVIIIDVSGYAKGLYSLEISNTNYVLKNKVVIE